MQRMAHYHETPCGKHPDRPAEANKTPRREIPTGRIRYARAGFP